MAIISLSDGLRPRAGCWRLTADIHVANVAVRDIYRAPQEPSYVCWAILWKERSGAVKLSFVEATGDPAAWPPTYNFTSGDIEYYLKTLVSEDGGRTWTDTGWRENLDKSWIRNPDHHIRHVFEMADGRLLRNYCHTVAGRTAPCYETTYDPKRADAGEFFPFSNNREITHQPKSASIWTSPDGGRSWQEIRTFTGTPPLFLTAIHPLRDGRIVALGAKRPSELDYNTWSGVLIESGDGGSTWSEPLSVAPNLDPLNPEGIDEECDFVELDDGRLLLLWRTNGHQSCMRQQILEPAAAGWHFTPPVIKPRLVHSGYPYMHRAADGTVFYYCHTALRYTCDDGITWKQLPLGHSYYGQLTEVAAGRMLAVTQHNIGDCPYPWRHDVSMRQTTFDYERIAVAEQEDAGTAAAVALLDVGTPTDFHLCLEMRLDAAAGIAYQAEGEDCRFVALTLPANPTRLPNGRADGDQTAFLQIGTVAAGQTRIIRKTMAGKVEPGTWVELQVSRRGDLLTVACRVGTDEGWGPVYTCVRDKGAAAGGIGLFTCLSTAAFRNVRFDAAPGRMRENWVQPVEAAMRIPLDAGRGGD